MRSTLIVPALLFAAASSAAPRFEDATEGLQFRGLEVAALTI